jgi:hypothetical protein
MWACLLVSLLAAQYAFQQPKTLEKHITKRDRWPTKNTKAELAIAGQKTTLTYWRGRLCTPSPAAPCQISVIHSIHQHHHSYFVRTDSSSSSSFYTTIFNTGGKKKWQTRREEQEERKSTCSLSTGTPAGTCEAITVQLLNSGDDDARKAGDDDGRTASSRLPREREKRGRERERENWDGGLVNMGINMGTLGTLQRCLALWEDKECELGSSIPWGKFSGFF